MPGGVSPCVCVLLFVGCPFPRDELLGGWWRAKVAFPHCSTPPPLASTPCEGLSERDGGLVYVQCWYCALFSVSGGLCVCEECVSVVGWTHPQLIVFWSKRIKLGLCIFCSLADSELVRRFLSSMSDGEVSCCMSSLEFEYVSVAEVCCGMSSLSCGMSSLRFDIVAGLCVIRGMCLCVF